MAEPHTLVHQLAHWAESKGDEPAIYERSGEEWVHLTWSEYWSKARLFARGLIELGHQVGDCVAIVGDNRPDWVICQFGIMAARGVPAPIYTTNTDEQVAYIVAHCRAKIAICDSEAQLAKYLRGIEAGSISVEHIICMDPRAAAKHEGVLTLHEVMEMAVQQGVAELDNRLSELTDTETALLIYTSGTTGEPKAVQLHHQGMMLVANGILDNFPLFREPGRYVCVSYLPLCHVAEQVFTNMLHLATGGQVYFCPDLKEIKDYLVHVRPTLFLGVPRVWEKFQAVLEARLAEATGIKAMIASWGRKTELAAFHKEVETGEPVAGFARNWARKLVIDKVQEALGLDRLICAATGAAPISTTTLEFFASLGITIYEGFGMSETSGVATVSAYGKPRFGTVGKPLPGVEVRIAEDGEIRLRGANMTKGYLHNPEKTAELYPDGDDWLATGDLGALDDEGNLKITGRKKDLIITAGGKNVAPIELESYIKSIVGVGQAVVVGDRQPYLCALVTLDPEALPELRNRLEVDGDLAALASNPKVKEYVTAEVEARCNAQVARYQTIKKVEILGVEFSVETDELTPTMKLKRNVVNAKYSEVIAQFYA